MRALLCIPLAALAACSFSESEPRYDTGLDELDIVSVQPDVLVPGTVLVVEGQSFVESPWGESKLVLAGTFTDGGQSRDVSFKVPVRFADFDHLEVEVTEDSDRGARRAPGRAHRHRRGRGAQRG